MNTILNKRDIGADEYQRKASEFAAYEEGVEAVFRPEQADLGKLVYLLTGLAGEAGEVLNRLKKAIRDGSGLTPELAEYLADELGDIRWYGAESARILGLSESGIARRNLEKLGARKGTGTLTGEIAMRPTGHPVTYWRRGNEIGWRVEGGYQQRRKALATPEGAAELIRELVAIGIEPHTDCLIAWGVDEPERRAMADRIAGSPSRPT